MITLGLSYRDIVSNFTGVAIERSERYEASTAVYLQPGVLDGVKMYAGEWFPEGRLVLVQPDADLSRHIL